jgi:hypothetical protein
MGVSNVLNLDSRRSISDPEIRPFMMLRSQTGGARAASSTRAHRRLAVSPAGDIAGLLPTTLGPEGVFASEARDGELLLAEAGGVRTLTRSFITIRLVLLTSLRSLGSAEGTFL